jgi:hypothetical protein
MHIIYNNHDIPGLCQGLASVGVCGDLQKRTKKKNKKNIKIKKANGIFLLLAKT